MRNMKTPLLVLGMAVVIAVLAGTSVVGANPAGGSGCSVDYVGMGNIGELTIVGDPGTNFEVYDTNGNPVASGMLDSPQVTFMAPNSGTAPDGTIHHVVCGGDIVAVADPEWDWD